MNTKMVRNALEILGGVQLALIILDVGLWITDTPRPSGIPFLPWPVSIIVCVVAIAWPLGQRYLRPHKR